MQKFWLTSVRFHLYLNRAVNISSGHLPFYFNYADKKNLTSNEAHMM